MKHFLCKLIPPRSTFAQDMTEVERKVMQEHGAYWSGLVDRRVAVIFGPVADPKGVYGLAIVESEDEKMIHNIITNDPIIKSGIGFKFEINMMIQSVLRK